MGYIITGLCFIGTIAACIFAMKVTGGAHWQPKWIPVDMQQLLPLEQKEQTTEKDDSQTDEKTNESSRR